jgi:ribosomal RNA-processing protein 36
MGKVTGNKSQNFNHQSSSKSEDAEKLAIRQELSSLSFEELQKLKEKMGSTKFNERVIGSRKRKPPVKYFERDNRNRPREMSSKKRRVEEKVAIQVPKVFRVDPRFDNLCGEFNENVS